MKYTVEVDECNTVWYKEGTTIRHREDGPAIEYANGSKAWFINGKCHKEDGPAIEYVDGSKVWCISGQTHREDGPAVEYADGTKEWYINGQEFTEEQFNARNTLNGKTVIINDKQYKLVEVPI
jgi:hypothetical protein